jgi:hypothetical protein
MNLNIVDLAKYKTYKMWFLDVEYLILIEFHYQIVMASMLYVFTDGLAVQPAENPPNSDG